LAGRLLREFSSEFSTSAFVGKLNHGHQEFLWEKRETRFDINFNSNVIGCQINKKKDVSN
jgi:hypothetical protein